MPEDQKFRAKVMLVVLFMLGLGLLITVDRLHETIIAQLLVVFSGLALLD